MLKKIKPHPTPCSTQPWTTPLPAQATSLHTASPQGGPPSPEAEEPKPILVTLDCVQFDSDTPAPPATRELQVGCIRTTQPSAKKVTTALLQVVPWKPLWPLLDLPLRGLA